jgi:hypothetical protein
LSANINVVGPFSPLLSGEDPQVERERPFLSDRRSKVLEYVFMHSTPLPGIDAIAVHQVRRPPRMVNIPFLRERRERRK